jgi:choline dehydrogenase-like flavoprotein
VTSTEGSEKEHPHLDNPPWQDRPERIRALSAVCDTFLPGGNGLPSATELGVPRRIRDELDALGRPELLADLNRFLDTIESAVFNFATTGHATRFSALRPDQREDYLRRWAASPIALKRRGFQVMKRLALLYGCGVEGSPYWQVAGYRRPPLDAPATAAPLRIRRLQPGETVDADACIIGSGAGGGVVAAALAAARKKVLVLERARLVPEAEMDWHELSGYASFYVDRGIASSEDRAIAILAGSAVGGGTLVNWTTSLRLPGGVREEWRQAGVEGLDADYDAVEQRLDVDLDETNINGPNRLLRQGAEQLSYSFLLTPRNVHGCGDCGLCGFGCRRGAKQSTMRTYLVDACVNGAEIADGAEAWRIEHSSGKVTGVAIRVDGGEARVRTPLVAVAGGSILSPALLLRSGIAEDQAGQNLHIHPTTAVVGTYGEDVRGWEGPPQGVVIDHFFDFDAGYGFIIECPAVPPGLLAASLPWWSSGQFQELLAQSGRMAAFITLVRDRDGGRVSVDGAGHARVDYKLGELERRHMVRAIIEAGRLHKAAGAEQFGSVHTPPVWTKPAGAESFFGEVARRGVEENRIGLFTAHQMGSCRIGKSARTSVADPDGKVWGIDGLYITDASAFPTASGVNPMLTAMALARRTAARMP